ncbi:MAG: hypothetical protein JNL28_03540 [Planctomycetes bacterium]|nr:hypothetical protein [Planctomycetota bacterium]
MSILSRSLALILASSALAFSAQAQTNFPFVLNQAASNFTFGGTTTLGPLVGNPSNMFQLLGTQNLDLAFQAGAQPFASGAFTNGGVVGTNGALHAKITGAFGITLATIDINNMTLSATSPTFTVGAGGAFNATVVLTALSGQFVVTPLVGTPSTTDMTGSTSAPTAVNGTLTLLGGNYRMVAPINTVFAFTDPGTGASGNVTLVGTITADYPFLKPYCFGDGPGTACPCGNNSTLGQQRGCLHSGAQGAKLVGSGIPSLTADTLVLQATSQPAGTLGLFFQGTGQSAAGLGAPFGDGLICVGGSIIRLGIKAAPSGSSNYPAAGDASVSVQGLVGGAPTIRNYQLWYRDAAAFCTAATYNLTNGLQVQWMP